MSDGDMLDIAANLICQQGIASCSFRNLAKEAGTSQSPFTYRFRSRQNLLLAVVERCFDRVRSKVEVWEQTYPPLETHYRSCLISLQLQPEVDPYLRSYDQILSAAAYDAGFARALRQVQSHEMKFYFALLDRARQSGELSVPTDNGELLRTIAAVVVGLNMNRYTAAPEDWSPDSAARSFATSYQALFATTPALVSI